MDPQPYRALFPITQQYVYLDHATIAPVSLRVLHTQRVYLDQVSTAPFEQLGAELAKATEQLKQRAATLVGAARADEIVPIPNAVTGINIAANSLPLRAGDEVLVLDGDSPDVIYPWMNLAARGVRVKHIVSHSGGIDLEDLDRWIDGRTRVIALSSALSSTGFHHDLAALGARCRQRALFLVVDATPTLGALPLDVCASGIDILACDGHKWLLGGDGSGLLYVRHDLLNRLQLGAYVGAEGVVTSQYDRDLNFTFQQSSERFNIGSASPVGVLGLNAALGLLHEVGLPAISERILDLTDMLIGDLRERGYRVRSQMALKHRSGIVVVDLPDPQRAHQRLRTARVIAAQVPDGLRFSPHFYNSEEEMLRVGELLGNAR